MYHSQSPICSVSLVSSVPPRSSFLGEPTFITAFISPESFSWWHTNSLTTLADLQIGGVFAPFDLLHMQKQILLREFYQLHSMKGFAVTLLEVRVSFEISTNELSLPILLVRSLICAERFQETGKLSFVSEILEDKKMLGNKPFVSLHTDII